MHGLERRKYPGLAAAKGAENTDLVLTAGLRMLAVDYYSVCLASCMYLRARLKRRMRGSPA